MAADVNNQHLLLATATSKFSTLLSWQSLLAAIHRRVVVALRQGDEFLFSGALSWWRHESSTSISCWHQQQAHSQLSFRGNRCLLPYSGKWWLRSGKETNFCFLVLLLCGGVSQQPASLVGNSKKQVLNFLYVAIAACCHTVASDGCPQPRGRLAVV